MKKIFFSISTIIIMATLFLIITPSVINAMPSAEEIITKGNDFTSTAPKIGTDKIATVLKPVASLLLAIGTVVLVVITAVMGVKYIAATPETRAKLKTQLIGIAISAVVLYGAYGIWSIVYNIMNGLTS